MINAVLHIEQIIRANWYVVPNNSTAQQLSHQISLELMEVTISNVIDHKPAEGYLMRQVLFHLSWPQLRYLFSHLVNDRK